jgi:hypothetical protein
MTEEDTIKRLSGLTYEQCKEVYTLHYLQYVNSHVCDKWEAWDYVDTKLKPYGWTCRSMEAHGLSL